MAGGGIEQQLDEICTVLGKAHGQLALALVRRKLSRQLVVEQVEQVEQVLTQLQRLLSTIQPSS